MQTKSLGEMFPKEQARVREILGHYKEIGPVGAFGAMHIEESLLIADKAAMSGDVSAMIASYKDLQLITG